MFSDVRLFVADSDQSPSDGNRRRGAGHRTWPVCPKQPGRLVLQASLSCLDELRLSEPRHDRFITYVTDRPDHDKRYAIDASKLETGLGWRAKETFDTGIKKTVRWYLERSDWWKPIRDNVDRGERLGL